MLMFDSIKEVFRRPTAESYAQRHLEEARLDLLKWENALRYAEAQVSYHKATIEALGGGKHEGLLFTKAERKERGLIQSVSRKASAGGE